MFSLFEREAHKRIGQDRMSGEDLSALYQERLKKMFQDSVRYSEDYQWEWASIPHIFESPFYVYAYNFGNLLVLSLYQQYLEEGPSFIPKLKKLLSLGSSQSPAEIVSVVGVDIHDPEFWQKGLRYIEQLIDQLQQLSGEAR